MEIKSLSMPNVNLDGSLKKFDSISLEGMRDFELLDRAETKYVINKAMLKDILDSLSQNYKVLEINGNKEENYCTVYFDTPDFKMYNAHHNGALNRYKVRTREYIGSKLSFVEVKFKDNKRKTIKKRIPIPESTGYLASGAKEFVQEKSPFSSENLSEVLWNYYTRITLASKNSLERLTIDTNLKFYDGTKKKHVELPDLAVIELKQKKFSNSSYFVRLMHQMGVRPLGFSKYCIGVCSVYDNVKSNNFKEKLMIVNKLEGVGK